MLNTNNRKIQNFKNNKRGLYSLYLLLLMLVFTLPAEFIANDKPLLIKYDNNFYFPIIQNYAETVFGGDFETTADYKDSFVTDLIKQKGWIVWPLIPFNHQTVNYNLEVPAPSPPSFENILGTDDQARDVLARLIYGFRISILFGFLLTFFFNNWNNVWSYSRLFRWLNRLARTKIYRNMGRNASFIFTYNSGLNHYSFLLDFIIAVIII